VLPLFQVTGGNNCPEPYLPGGQTRYHSGLPQTPTQATALEWANLAGEEFTLRVMDLGGKVVLLEKGLTDTKYVLGHGLPDLGIYIAELHGTETFKGKIVVEEPVYPSALLKGDHQENVVVE